MRLLQTGRSGSTERAFDRRSPHELEREWHEAQALERAELARWQRRPSPAGLMVLVLLVPLAVLVPAAVTYERDLSSRTQVGVLAAIAAASVAVLVVPISLVEFRRSGRQRTGTAVLLYGCALLSAGAAAIHFAVARMHFDEYLLFGVFFVASGIGQLTWAMLAAARPRPWVLLAGAAANLAIAALWVFDRIWGLPIGPEHWEPDPVGFGDVTSSAFELLLAGGSLFLVRRAAGLRSVPRPGGKTLAAVALPVTAFTTVALLSVLGIGAPAITPST